MEFKGRYYNSVSLVVKRSDIGGLDAAAASVEKRWRKDGWAVSSERSPDSPTRRLSAFDGDGVELRATYVEDYVENYKVDNSYTRNARLSITVQTPCARPS